MFCVFFYLSVFFPLAFVFLLDFCLFPFVFSAILGNGAAGLFAAKLKALSLSSSLLLAGNCKIPLKETNTIDFRTILENQEIVNEQKKIPRT